MIEWPTGYLWRIGCCGRTFLSVWVVSIRLMHKVFTPFESSDFYPVSAGVPQGGIWSPLLFNLNVRLLPSFPRHCSVIGYADDHTLLTTIPDKTDRFTAAINLNANLATLCENGHPWNIRFVPQKTSLISTYFLKFWNFQPSTDNTCIPKVFSIKVLGFLF